MRELLILVMKCFSGDKLVRVVTSVMQIQSCV